MLEISPKKIAHVIVRSREYDATVPVWEEDHTEEVLENVETIIAEPRDDATLSEVSSFIDGLNEDEQASLVAVAWIGRGSFSADELTEAIETARSERVVKTSEYLLGMPMLPDFLEEGLDRLGISVEDAEHHIL